MARRHGRGKSVTGPEMGFIIGQAVAGMLLFGVLCSYLGARVVFEPGEEYLPVTIIYTASEEHIETYMDDGKIRTRKLYDNSYYYIVDGVRYDGQVKDAYYGVAPGDQETRYYNPNNPNELSYYQSLRDMMGQAKRVAVAAVLFEGLAVYSAIKIWNKKRRLLQVHEDYEESIRQDIQTNREIYQSLEMSIDKEKIFSKLEPLRKRIDKNQKSIERIKERAAGSNGIFYLIIKVVDTIRLPRLQNQLDMDNTLFYKEYKMNIAEPILNRLFEEFQYRPSQGFSIDELTAFKVITGNLSIVESEDYIEGVYKGVHYRQADVKKEKSASASELLYMTAGLQGRVSVYDFNKPIQGDIIIRTKKTNAYIGNMEKVVMENLQFNEKFDVYATDAHTVFYLLTPQFMEYLLRLKLWGDTVFRFSDNKIFVLRNHVSGIFEPDMGRTLDIAYEIGKSYNELKEVLDFIDILKLEQAEGAAADGLPFGYSRFGADKPVEGEKSMEGDRPVGAGNLTEAGNPIEADNPMGAGNPTEADDSLRADNPADGGSQDKSSSGFRLKLE